jgi:hypothetical protein
VSDFTFVAGALPDSELGQNTFAYYQFTDDGDTSTLSDFEGSNDGSISGMQYVSDDVAGRVVGEFDGTGDLVDGFAWPSLSAYTVGIIVKPLNVSSNWGGTDTIFSSRNNNSLDIRSDGSSTWQIFHGSGSSFIGSVGNINSGALQTIVARWDGSTLQFSVDDPDTKITDSQSDMNAGGENDGLGGRAAFGGDRFANCQIVHVELSNVDEGGAFESRFHSLI